MPGLDELAENTGTQLSGVLQSAVETLSSGQEITFRLYVKQVLPLDGFVYWINAAIINPAELTRLGIEYPHLVTIKGSLHRQIANEQTETISRSVNNIIFTPIEQMDDFNTENPDTLYLGEYQGTQFAFSRMDSRYSPSGIFHYRGKAILPTMRSQIIDDPQGISDELILSDSTPIWLSLNQFATVYPAFLAPANRSASYLVAEVRTTTALQVAARIADRRWQHVQDKVRITLYGMSNQQALNYLDYVIDKAQEDEAFGITNLPVIQDGKSSQVEINALAKLKYIDFDVNYYQATSRDISRQLIKNVIFNYEVQ